MTGSNDVGGVVVGGGGGGWWGWERVGEGGCSTDYASENLYIVWELYNGSSPI